VSNHREPPDRKSNVVKPIRHLAWTLAVLIPLAITPQALAANVFPGVGSVDFNEAQNTLSVVIPYGGRNPFRVQWLNGQNRLVVDVEGMNLPSNRAMYIGMGVVEQIRAARQRAGVTRLIFDLTQSADLRAMTDIGTRTLTITVFPRGAAPMAVRPPQTGYAPAPRPTRRPAPNVRPYAPAIPNVPVARVTPAPVMQPSFAPIAVPTPFNPPTPAPTAMPTFVPTPAPMVTPEPTEMPTEAPSGPAEFAVFGSRVYVGSDMPITFHEGYESGGSDTNVGFNLGGNFGWDQMFNQYFGISLGGHAMSYTIDDAEAATGGTQITHKRGDYEGNLGLRGRLPLGGGLEFYAQPGVALRMVTVDTVAQPLDADGNPTGDPLDNSTIGETYLTSPWTGYGPNFQLGVGYHVFGPLSLAGTGEVNYLFGSMGQPSVASIFPLLGIRAGAEARLDFGLVGATLGYNYTTYSHADLSQSWTGPYIKLNVVY
jgi:hypothetical protein